MSIHIWYFCKISDGQPTLPHHFRTQRQSGFSKWHHFRMYCKSSCNYHSLFRAVWKGGWTSICFVLKSNFREGSIAWIFAFSSFIPSHNNSRKWDFSQDCHMRKEVKVLEYHFYFFTNATDTIIYAWDERSPFNWQWKQKK